MPHIAADANDPKARCPRPAARWAVGVLFAFASLLCPTPARSQGLDDAVLTRMKHATVYIKNKVAGELHSIGSGFAIKVTGDTVLVMTNKHVVADMDEADRPAGGAKTDIFVVFRSGTPEQQEVPARLVTYDTRDLLDLAILEVKGVRQPPKDPIRADRPVEESNLRELMTTYSFGFPFIDVVNAKDVNVNPPVTANALTIGNFQRGESGRVERIKIAGSVIQGNSGGPVVNDKGDLVGVVVSRIIDEGVGYIIPPNVIRSFLEGDIDITFGQFISSSGNTARVAVGGRLVDPFGKKQKMSARYLLKSALPNPPKADIKGRYPVMPGSKTIPLEVRPSTTIRGLPVADAAGYGEVDLPINTPADRTLYFQIVLTDSFGNPYGSEPALWTIPNNPEPGLHDLRSKPQIPRSLAQFSCLVNLADGAKIKNQAGLTTISVPGEVAKTVSRSYNLYNAPCALVQVDGDFVATVEVLNSFDPGSKGVILPTGRETPGSFQSTGILVWQDEKNYVRLERCKGSDGGIGMFNQVWVEVYKDGRAAVKQPIDVPEQPIGLLVLRQGASIRLLFALLSPNQKDIAYRLFEEMAVDFDNEVFVGLAAANFSKRKFEAKLTGFHLRTPENKPIVAKRVPKTTLIEPGMKVLEDGTQVYEGAQLSVAPPSTSRTPVDKQKKMKEKFNADWSDDQQLLWRNEKRTGALNLELPVDAAGKYEIKARFTLGPEYAIAKVAIDGKPLNKDATIDLYSQEVRPGDLISLGTLPLDSSKHKLTITVFNKNPRSTGYHVGLDEVRLVPAKEPQKAPSRIASPVPKR